MSQPTRPEGWVDPPRADDLPCCDGEPLESDRHRRQMNLLIDSIEHHWANRDDFFAGGNMFVYFSSLQAKNNDFRGPDFFVVTDVARGERKSWIVWDEGGRTPEVIVELLSESTRDTDFGEKKRIYERVLRVPEYFVFDPFSGELWGFRLAPTTYQEIPRTPGGRLSSTILGLELGVRSGRYQGIEADWLRMFTANGGVVPTKAEAATQRADAAAQRAEAEAQRAEAEAQRADEMAAKLAAYESRFGSLDASDDESPP
ncbi:MAG: Uma2 family endonuclease [Myxococcota bacterium]